VIIDGAGEGISGAVYLSYFMWKSSGTINEKKIVVRRSCLLYTSVKDVFLPFILNDEL